MNPIVPVALTFALGLAAVPTVADVVLINTFEVPKGQREATIEAWEAARDFLAAQPGYISSELHRSITQEARFALINVAHWESPAAFWAAIEAMRAARVFQPPAGVTSNPALYTVIATD